MTAAPTVAAVRLRVRAAAGISADTCAVGVLFLLTGVLALFTWGAWGDMSIDTGYDVLAGIRVAGGELPYADFVYYYGPLAPLVLGFAELFGGGLGPALVVGFATTAAIVVATYALARLLAGPLAAFLAAAFTAAVAFEPTNYSYVLPHTYSATFGLLLTLLFLLAIARERVGLAGLCAGLVALTRPEFALAVAVAAGVWLVVRGRAGLLRRGEILRLAVPALALPAAVYGVLAVLVGPHQLLLENLYPIDELRAGGNEILRSYAPFTLSSFADLGLKLLAYAAGTAALLALAGGVAKAGRFWGGVFAAAATAIAAAAATADPEALRSGLYLATEWIPAGAVIAFAVLAIRAWRRREISPTAHLELLAVAALTVLVGRMYVGFVFHAAPFEQPSAYMAPFAGLFLARLHLGRLARTPAAATAGAIWLAFIVAAGAGLSVKDARAEGGVVKGPGGTLHATTAEAATYNGVLEWITAGSAPGDPVLIAPQLTTLYVLSGREDPLDRLSLLPGVFAVPGEERSLIAQLESSGVRMAVIDRSRFTWYGHTRLGDSFGRRLEAWLEENFVRVKTFRSGDPTPRTVEIWVWKGS